MSTEKPTLYSEHHLLRRNLQHRQALRIWPEAGCASCAESRRHRRPSEPAMPFEKCGSALADRVADEGRTTAMLPVPQRCESDRLGTEDVNRLPP